jgi:hypothetical protein
LSIEDPDDPKIYLVASPYWQTSSFPNGWQFTGNEQLGETCDIGQLHNPSGPNMALLFFSSYPDGYCDNTFDIIDRAKTLGYSGIIFYGYSNFLDWNTQRKLDFPSFYVPSWQSEQLSYTPSFTRINGDFKAPSTLAGGFMFGSWKFYNESAGGRWTLSVRDVASGNTGNLRFWSIQIRYGLYENGSGEPENDTAAVQPAPTVSDPAPPEGEPPNAENPIEDNFPAYEEPPEDANPEDPTPPGSAIPSTVIITTSSSSLNMCVSSYQLLLALFIGILSVL